jgi:transposase
MARRYEPKTFDLRGELKLNPRNRSHQRAWHQRDTAPTIQCEIATDVSRFRNASAFASWLGLYPENKISGGKLLFISGPGNLRGTEAKL